MEDKYSWEALDEVVLPQSPYPSVGVQLVVPMSSPWSPCVVAHLCLTRNDTSEDLTCRCQPWSATDITARTWLATFALLYLNRCCSANLGELLVLTHYLQHPH